MLMCDFTNLRAELDRLQNKYLHGYHLDVMDGNFVPNLTYGFPIIEAFRELTDLHLDAHLMISNPSKYAMQFVEAGVDSMTFHIEAIDDPTPVLKEVHAAGVIVGLAINPSTPIERLLKYLPLCDMALVMSVEAGFGGQAFDTTMLDRVSRIRREAGPEFLIEMDGGINAKTIASCHHAGTDLFVVGSAIFGQPDTKAAMKDLHELL